MAQAPPLSGRTYLSQVSPEWNQTFGAGKSVQWTVGLGAQGNEGVSNTIKNTPNSIGYVELTYALTTDMDYASLMNKAGNFVEPTVNSTLVAVQDAIIMNGTSSRLLIAPTPPLSHCQVAISHGPMLPFLTLQALTHIRSQASHTFYYIKR